jgi:hypothetical protein
MGEAGEIDMTREQADTCILAIYAPYDKRLRTETQVDAMIDYLLEESYEIIMPAIKLAVKTSEFPPNPARIEKAKTQIAESQRYRMPGPTPINEYAIWRQERIASLSEQEYLDYLQDQRASNAGQWEAKWQHEYRLGIPARGGQPACQQQEAAL